VFHSTLVSPPGLRSVATNVYEAILHRTAVGHDRVGGVLVPTTKWAVSYCTAPSGSHLAMSARDLLELVRPHLTDPALAVLREPQVDFVPDFGGGISGWGLGWMLYPGGVVGHSGVSKGQKASLRVVPSAGVAVAVLTNCAGGEPLAHEILNAVLGELAGIETPPPPVPPAHPEPVEDWMCGTYRTTLFDITLAAEDGRAFLTYRPRHDLAESLLGKPENRVEVVRLGDTAIIATEPTSEGHQVLSLVGSDEHGRARYLHYGAAAYRVG
jgi:CubicO group peptidase (beta-lactamase class C family)